MISTAVRKTRTYEGPDAMPRDPSKGIYIVLFASHASKNRSLCERLLAVLLSSLFTLLLPSNGTVLLRNLSSLEFEVGER
jgi:hypothetical protein